MTKHKIWIKVVPQIQRNLLNTLFDCKAIFEVNPTEGTFFITDVCHFNLDQTDKSDAMYRIDVDTNNNNKSIFIQRDNLLEFTIHFRS